MTLNGIMAVILRYFSEFGYILAVLRKSSHSLSHLLMSSCMTYRNQATGGIQSSLCLCLSQARINWEGCGRKGIRCKNGGGLMEVIGPDGVAPTQIVSVSASCYPL